MMHDKVMKFINGFTDNGKRQGVIKCFTEGHCYWFAHILFERFGKYEFVEPFIMYDDVSGHFGCRICGHVYDITGDVSDSYTWGLWRTYERLEPKHATTIRKCCILKEE